MLLGILVRKRDKLLSRNKKRWTERGRVEIEVYIQDKDIENVS